ncbi:MAG TPA: hypothetical protein VGB63_13110 [Pedobacter sp.]
MNLIEVRGLVVEMIEDLIFNAHPKLLHECSREDNVIISAPQLIIDMFFQGLRQKYQISSLEDYTKSLVYEGIKFVPSYEMSVVLFHKYYPIYKEDWMIEKILLFDPEKETKEIYSKYVIQLGAYIKVNQL